MGFRAGACATVWEVLPGSSGRSNKGRISISKKNILTDQWEDDFKGYVLFAGDAFQQSQSLKPKDRIWIEYCDVTNRWDKEKQREYTNFTIFSFTTTPPVRNGGGQGQSRPSQPQQQRPTRPSQQSAPQTELSAADLAMAPDGTDLPW